MTNSKVNSCCCCCMNINNQDIVQQNVVTCLRLEKLLSDFGTCARGIFYCFSRLVTIRYIFSFFSTERMKTILLLAFIKKQFRIQETKHLSTDSDSSTNTKKIQLIRQNSPKTIFLRGGFRPFMSKTLNLRPLLSITFPQGFRKSKKFGHWTLGSGGKKRNANTNWTRRPGYMPDPIG